MALLDLPDECIRDIFDCATESGVSLASCSESCRRLARLSHPARVRSLCFTLKPLCGPEFGIASTQRLEYAASDQVRQHVKELAFLRPAATCSAQTAGDAVLCACERLHTLTLNGFRPSDGSWKALAASQLQSLTIQANTGDLPALPATGFAYLRELRVTFALSAGEQVLQKCQAPLRLLYLRHFEAPSPASFRPSLWDSLVHLALDCGISATAMNFLELFRGLQDVRQSTGDLVPLRTVHLESRRLDLSVFCEIVSCLRGLPLTQLGFMVTGNEPCGLLNHIAECLPTLQKLSVLYHPDGLLQTAPWPHPAETYAKILAKMPCLQSIGINHRCYTFETYPGTAGVGDRKGKLIYDYEWLGQLAGSHPRLQHIILFGMTAALLGPAEEPAHAALDPSLHYRGRRFRIGADRVLTKVEDALFFPL